MSRHRVTPTGRHIHRIVYLYGRGREGRRPSATTPPFFAFINLVYPLKIFDFRLFYVLSGGSVFFVVMCLDIQRITTSNILKKRFTELFFPSVPPVLPKEHFF